MTEPPGSQREFAPVWQAMESLLPAFVSPAYRAGMIGASVRGAGQPLLASDLTHLLIPGLAALGIQVRLVPLVPEARATQESLAKNIPLLPLRFATPLLFTPPEEITDATPVPRESDPRIITQAPMEVKAFEGSLPQQNVAGAFEPATTLPSSFSHALVMVGGVPKAPRRLGIQAALHRWLAWHAAYPNRVPQETDLSDPACALAAAFLAEVVGTRRDFVSNRLRYAGQCFEAAQIEHAYDWLLEAGVATWQFPPATAEALLTPPEAPLSDTRRQELIYLARAGTLPLKTLAARRLTHELSHPDARKTLHQLRFDLDPWVRAAACPIGDIDDAEILAVGA